MNLELANKLGSIKVSSPSNIAFIKYWGKKGRQLPINPSLSMTLSQCVSNIEIEFFKSEKFCIEEFIFDNDSKPLFKEKMSKFLKSISSEYDFLNNLSLKVKTSNTFPHSSGIASSASSISALIFAIMSFEAKLKGVDLDLKKASYFSRLGSGSASRSLYPRFSFWGESFLNSSSDEYACEFSEVHKDFFDLRNAVLILDKSVKKVSSTEGHRLMDNHEFKDKRIEQAHRHLEAIVESMQKGDFEKFGQVLEKEALSLHSLMMTSEPSFILMSPQTLSAIHMIRQAREDKLCSCYFTLDAGANLHLIYQKSESTKVEAFIKSHLRDLCVDGDVIFDEVGSGPIVQEVHLA